MTFKEGMKLMVVKPIRNIGNHHCTLPRGTVGEVVVVSIGWRNVLMRFEDFDDGHTGMPYSGNRSNSSHWWVYKDSISTQTGDYLEGNVEEMIQ